MNTIHVDVVSAEESIFSGEAEFVVLPGIDGELGIYPRHTPLFTQIKPGAVRIKIPGQAAEELVFVQGGCTSRKPPCTKTSSSSACPGTLMRTAPGLICVNSGVCRG